MMDFVEGFTLAYEASTDIGAVISELDRTEDIRFFVDEKRLAILDFTKNIFF